MSCRGRRCFSCKKTAKPAGPLFRVSSHHFLKNPRKERCETISAVRTRCLSAMALQRAIQLNDSFSQNRRDSIRSASSTPCSAPTQMRRILIADKIYLICWGISRAFLCQIPMNSRKAGALRKRKKAIHLRPWRRRSEIFACRRSLTLLSACQNFRLGHFGLRHSSQLLIAKENTNLFDIFYRIGESGFFQRD